MGLDMYLRAERFVSGYEFEGNEQRELYNGLRDQFGVGPFVDPHTPTARVSFTVAYWRKANAIHKWFVDNVQDGVDECQPSYVSREKLLLLRGACQHIADLHDTVAQIDRALGLSEDWSFEYQASW